MVKYIFVLGGLVLTSVGSFFLTRHFMPSQRTDIASLEPALEIMPVSNWVDELHTCNKKYPKDRITRCAQTASQLIRNLQRKANSVTRIDRQGLFALFLVENKLIFYKEKCSEADVKVDVFPINYYPVSMSAIPENRRKRGLAFLNQAAYFSKSGFKIKRGCLLTAALKVDQYDIKRLQAGQHNGKKWVWSVVWKSSKG